MAILWDVRPCSLVAKYNFLEKRVASLFLLDNKRKCINSSFIPDKRTKFLRKVCNTANSYGNVTQWT